MMIRCIAIDDEPLAIKQLVSYIEQTPFLELRSVFDNAMQAMEFLQTNTVDLMFVDIQMPDLNGMEFVKALTNPPKVVFTTAYSQYAAEGFQVDAADYLLKPIAYSDFLKTAEKVRQRYFNPSSVNIRHNNDFLFIRSEYKTIRINFSDILYVESMKEYVNIVTERLGAHKTLMSLKKLAEHLPAENFMRVHRSFIVNLDHVNVVERNRIVFGPNTYIPVSDQYRDVFQNFLDNNFPGQA